MAARITAAEKTRAKEKARFDNYDAELGRVMRSMNAQTKAYRDDAAMWEAMFFLIFFTNFWLIFGKL